MTTTSSAKVNQIAQFRMPPKVFQVSLTFDSSMTMTGMTRRAATRIGSSNRLATLLLRSSTAAFFDRSAAVPTWRRAGSRTEPD
jgi:hypothetical protein